MSIQPNNLSMFTNDLQISYSCCLKIKQELCIRNYGRRQKPVRYHKRCIMIVKYPLYYGWSCRRHPIVYVFIIFAYHYCCSYTILLFQFFNQKENSCNQFESMNFKLNCTHFPISKMHKIPFNFLSISLFLNSFLLSLF